MNIFSTYCLFESTTLVVNSGDKCHVNMAAWVGYTMGPIFKHIIDSVQLYFGNDLRNIVLESANFLWLVGVTLILGGSPQIIVQRCQIGVPMWSTDISPAANNSILKTGAQNQMMAIPPIFLNIANAMIYQHLKFQHLFYTIYQI